MTTVERHFNRAVVVLRLKNVSGNRTRYVSTGTAEVHLQRLDETASAAVSMVSGATHRAWLPIEFRIEDGDQVRDSENNLYSVVGVTDHGKGFAMNEHKEVLLRIYRPQELPTQ